MPKNEWRKPVNEVLDGVQHPAYGLESQPAKVSQHADVSRFLGPQFSQRLAGLYSGSQHGVRDCIFASNFIDYVAAN